MGLTKKRRYDSKDTRGMQTRFNLRFPEMLLPSHGHRPVLQKATKRMIKLRPEIVEEFNR